MTPTHLSFLISLIVFTACTQKTDHSEKTYPDVQIAGAMKNVMWKGELGGVIHLDTIADKEGLYAIGPLSFLRGEIMVSNGKSYVSTVLADSLMAVEETFDVSAPFLVYANVSEWQEMDLPTAIRTIPQLERYVDSCSTSRKRPFAFKLTGRIDSAQIHIQNLPEGSTVSSPEEAHRGQVNYVLNNEEVEIVGFFSTEHQGIFTHHDSFLHLHLITAKARKMGHLDAAVLGEMKLFLPRR